MITAEFVHIAVCPKRVVHVVLPLSAYAAGASLGNSRNGFAADAISKNTISQLNVMCTKGQKLNLDKTNFLTDGQSRRDSIVLICGPSAPGSQNFRRYDEKWPVRQPLAIIALGHRGRYTFNVM